MTWTELLSVEKSQEYFKSVLAFISSERKNHVVFPKNSEIFNAFNLTPLDSLKVVVLGQDPYHNHNQAHGLAFSVPAPQTKIPPSLVNIYKELHEDAGKEIPPHGNLEHWAQQGVLLLNSVLTVRAHQAGSHANQGWETFTDAVISHINNHCENIVFLLWGSYAQKKGSRIDVNKHLVLKAPHPSPLSAYRGFFGCKHFSKTNEYLKSKGKDPIHW